MNSSEPGSSRDRIPCARYVGIRSDAAAGSPALFLPAVEMSHICASAASAAVGSSPFSNTSR